jgi:tripartite-type tricarboxylate transporter receptor subunit TctC
MWGQPVIVENRPRRGTIGAAVVAKSPPDGYTLLVHSAAQAYNASIYPTLPYDTTKDFVEISPLGGQPNVLIVAPATGVKTVGELIALAKQKPGQLNFGSAGTGSGTHINAEKFKLAAGIDVVHIPYKGTPEALNDTLAGRVTYVSLCRSRAALPNIREGKLLALACARRSVRVHCPACRRLPRPGCRDSTITCGWACSPRRNTARHRRQDQQGRRTRGAVTGRSRTLRESRRRGQRR